MTFLVYATMSNSLSDNSQEIEFDGYLPRITERVYRTIEAEVHTSMSMGEPVRCATCEKEVAT